MKKLISFFTLSLIVFVLQAQTVPTVTPANPTVHCGDTAIITASGSTGHYLWYDDSTYTNIIGTDSTIYVGPLGNDTTVYVAAIAPGTVAIETYNFTNCGVTGMYGPIQSEVNTAYSGTSLDGDVTITTQGIQEWIVPTTGFYNIEVAGAQGGPYTTSLGHGAVLNADVLLTAGDTLKILVGQHGIGGVTSYPYGFSGGGGTFVSLYNNTPLIIAGGGGCDYNSGATSQNAGQTTNLGATGGAVIGSSGNGGNTSNNTGPGGGFYSDGSGAFGGEGFVNGGEGAYSTEHTFIESGFGGGGARGATYGEGCGGGYSGGNGGTSTSSWQGGAGGGSYVISTATNLSTSNGLYESVASFNGQSIIDLATYNSHNGYATIIFLDDTLSALVAVDITVDSLPEITNHPVNSAIHSGNNTSFYITATGVGINYQWQESTDSGTVWTNLTNTAPYSGVTTATLSITAATISMENYYYRCIVDGNCPPPDTSNAGILSITDVGINDFTLNKTSVYPNPVNDILIVKIDNKTFDFLKISIYDILGKLLMDFPEEELLKGINTFNLNVEVLAEGVYYLKIRMDEEQNTFKLIKN